MRRIDMFSTPDNRPKSLWIWLALILVLGMSCWLRVRYLPDQPLDYDEGHWLMFGTLVNAGYPAYTITFVGIPPLALLTIQLGEFLFGPTLAVRYPMMMMSLLGVAGIFWTLQPEKSWPRLLSAWLAAIFLSFNAVYFQNSASIMAEIPSVALSLLALALARQYYDQDNLFLLGLSGVMFALSLALKIFPVFLPVLIAVLIIFAVFSRQNRLLTFAGRRIVLAGAVWLAGFLFVLVVFALMYDFRQLYQQVFIFRLELREFWQQYTDLGENVIAVGQMWLNFKWLVIGAIVGVITGWRQRRLDVSIWLGWLGLATILLIWQIPLRDRYAVILVPALAALSGLGVANLALWSPSYFKEGHRQWLGRLVTFLLLIAVIDWTLEVPVQKSALVSSPDTFPDLNLEAVQYVWENSLADDCIITDDQRFAFAVDRLVPAALSESSWARIATGWLTVEDITEQVVLHNCPLVVYADQRFDTQLPDLRARLRELFFLEITFGGDVVVYAGNKQISKKPALPVAAQFGPTITFEGIDFAPTIWHSGQSARVATFWIAGKPVPEDYEIFLQLRNSRNETVASFDYFPFPSPSGNYQLRPNLDKDQNYSSETIAVYPARGMWPTSAWPVDQKIREVIFLTLPANLVPGTYELYLGMYDPDTQTRLPVYTESGASDALFLVPVEILNDNHGVIDN